MESTCSASNCQKKATMRCPICTQLGVKKNSSFCSQECYTRNFPIHRLGHGSVASLEPLDPKFRNFKFTGPLRPGTVSAQVKVPDGILKPDYSESGVPVSENKWNRNVIPKVESEGELEKLRALALIGRKALDLGHSMVKPGVSTDEINNAVHDFIISQGAYPSPLNYQGFPKSICSSVNEVICHGIPDSRKLVEGDIVNLDVSVYKDGFHTDLNETYPVGVVDDEARRLIEATERCLMEAISICKPGVMYRRVGDKIGEVIGKEGFAIVRSYCGHGVGKLFHCPPDVSHYPKNKDVGIMQKGHVFTIEPMINEGVFADLTWPDGWTSVTKDGKRSAQFEHSLLITDDGVEVLTKRLESSPPLFP